MLTWKLEIEYDGRRYAGWQQQKNSRTVQGELIKAATTVFDTRVDIGGAGRTDAGVHALRQVAHLRAVKKLAAHEIKFRINDLLPPDINIIHVQPAPARFNARHDAVARYYLYQISTRRTAFGKPYVWWIKDRLNVALMAEACTQIVGMHDFRSFCEPGEEQESTLVKVETAELATTGSLILFRIAASHFLWKMVRRIVGALVTVGRGEISVDHFHRLLVHHSKETAAWTAPPSGLFLERILYPGDPRPAPLAPAALID